ncbi:tRNA (guanosine(37)-N1)-methyltransferase TrmD [Candidatus Aerophobetes bacterium]|uniref:tRNA (guanine-N(1)-)-methyltransferase n=1 Tax=Aerophobetes bacterium TaxID=2030807 RepID=A0A2A4X806_UNCAE|nr:MAG: tRNA (guanosine(37)-N1)-methyltransferase TrmD [Candidatus Aerophobetes bacterium]
MLIDVLSLFPDYFDSPLRVSMLQRALSRGLLEVNCHNIRDFGQGRHNKVDDRPFGGGPGMVMMPGPIVESIRSVRKENSRVIYMSPQGSMLTASKCRKMAEESHLILLCGHYEGIDQRVFKEIDEEISIGPYVLTSGLPAAAVFIDAVARFVPGVLGNEDSHKQDSFEEGDNFDCPHYTKPRVFEEDPVPEVLYSGHQANIDQWRRAEAKQKEALVKSIRHTHVASM